LLPLLRGGSADALAGSLRGVLLHSLPDPLYEASPGWGHKERTAKGVKWTPGNVLPLRPEVMHGDKNQGTWRRVRVTALNPAETLVVDLREVGSPEPGRLLFTVFAALDARVDYHRENWEAGIKWYSASVRARCRVKLTLHCEATTRLEPSGLLLPDAIFRLRVLDSHLEYDNFVVEHIAGVGGEAAKVLGDAARKSLHQWHPSLERNVLAKAEAALVKAGDTKEVRLSLLQLLKKQTRTPAAPNAQPKGR
jgi:hypothetical protein